jgi:hypothetical protein
MALSDKFLDILGENSSLKGDQSYDIWMINKKKQLLAKEKYLDGYMYH